MITSGYNGTEAVRQLIFPKTFLSLWKSVRKILWNDRKESFDVNIYFNMCYHNNSMCCLRVSSV